MAFNDMFSSPQQSIGDIGSLIGGALGAYGTFNNTQNQQGVSNAAQAGYSMGRGAYNPTLFGGNGVGGTGFSVSSPSGGPGSISTNLGAFSPMYSNLAGYGANNLGISSNLANTASTGATGAYNTALSSMLPQLQNMQNNLLMANNNALFQRGQLGSGSFGQYGNAGNPTNLTTSSLAQGFGQQDLQAIMAAQNQGLNFFNSNLAGATGLGNLGFGATNTGLGMIGAQNALGQLPLQYSQLFGNQQIGATSALAQMIRGANMAQAPQNAYGPLGQGIAGMFGQGGLLGQGGPLSSVLGSLFGGNNPSALTGVGPISSQPIDMSQFGGVGAGTGAGTIGDLTGVGGISSTPIDIGSLGGAGTGLGAGASTIGDLTGVGGIASTPIDLGALGGATGAGAGAAGAGSLADLTGVGGIASTPIDMSALGSVGAAGTGVESAATAGSVLGGAAALAAPLAVAAFGASTSPFDLGANYWSNLNNALTGKGSGNATYDQYTSAAQQRVTALDQLGSMTTAKDPNMSITPAEWNFLNTIGITPQNLASTIAQANKALTSPSRSRIGGQAGKVF